MARNTPHTSVRLADMPRVTLNGTALGQLSRNRTLMWHELPEVWIKFPSERVGGAGTQAGVYLVPVLFNEHSRNARRVLFSDPLNGFDNDVLCVQLEEDSIEDRAHLGAKFSQRLVG